MEPNRDTELKVQYGASSGPWAGRLVVALLLGGLLLLTYQVVQDFLVPLLWAFILAYVTWPLNCRLRRMVSRPGLASFLMTLLLAVLIIVPVLLVIASLQQEARDLFQWIEDTLSGEADRLPTWLLSLPLVGRPIADLAEQVAQNPKIVDEWLTTQAPNIAGGAAEAAGAVGRNAMKFGMALLAVFFIYRDGEVVMAQFRQGLQILLGRQSDVYWIAAAEMTRAVVYGLVLTAIAQGAMAGLGYWIVGMEAPVLIGVLTALAALVPFGAPVVWGTVVLYLLFDAQLWAGLGLLAWGALGVSSVDNVVRPLVISVSAHIPFLLVLFGVLGGLSAFGLVGLFLGPVVLSVLLAVWRRWLGRRGTPREGPETSTEGAASNQ
ncbi:AI-2E family transporter [Thiohalomonas denitrificans]|uniref:Predicted PurR-regulated permease PerM n=1 Tax=Thiohalomonas denitrificans TaxID=415747 RepID=A0A1G5QDS8_9GAMM|nr:AI-2E family transporter [Thiohalomonas denitrificans]SCZ60045.1 Predicted PurR-regulated permease PerM [Thiohalomonas denitrificans]